MTLYSTFQLDTSCEFCGTLVSLRQLPSGRLLPYEAENIIHRCKGCKEARAQRHSAMQGVGTVRVPTSDNQKRERLGLLSAEDPQSVLVHRTKNARPGSASVPTRAALNWHDPFFKRSVLRWVELDSAQYVLALAEKDELVIKAPTGSADWYFQGRVDGRVIPARFFAHVSEGVRYAENSLRRWGKLLMPLLKREDRWRTSAATPVQYLILKSFRHPFKEHELSKKEATTIIQHYARGERG
ncbi:hypothetical protein Acid345_4270 [Candidatus Koribacter versatilis Ellin345]|uniref:Uncharacterized protein n=1 Tax=Koribacter versatilis (strain Ellin345) TaxID=204669 RepID=Q1IIN0_KORVE|nr:hypothetical protein Acid345_4270 [Candidatus Koribacter versatilis Ellin345]